MANPEYDPFKLLESVKTTLAEVGLEPRAVGDFNRVRLASDLLRSYGIDPVITAESTLDLDGHAKYHRREGDA